MMKLTAQNVEAVLTDCLFRDGECTREEAMNRAVIGQGVTVNFAFHPERLAAHKAEIKEMLDQLPEPFHKDKGGGWTFLNACVTQDGDQWGEHRNIEQLVALGIATRQATFCMPRSMWNVLPGGMPYIAVGDFSDKPQS